MKVFIDQPDYPALNRIKGALIKHAPRDIIFTDYKAADLVILGVIGRQDATARKIESLHRPYTIIQYCVRSTKRPSTENWQPLWAGSELTWSYYDLKALCREDKVSEDFSFYHSPLGVDYNLFRACGLDRIYIIATSGPSYLTESVREAIIAAKKTSGDVFHLGPQMKQPNTLCMENIEDGLLARFYNQSKYVSGLRRIEGFELPAAEGLLCGARPILFDKPHYRQWYGRWGVFISEGSRAEVISSLEQIFLGEYRPVTEREIEEARNLFSWKTIITGFWDRCLH